MPNGSNWRGKHTRLAPLSFKESLLPSRKKDKKGKMYQVIDQNIKKLSQIRTEYLSYQIMNKSHRVVRMI